jgi:hypothetical protein
MSQPVSLGSLVLLAANPKLCSRADAHTTGGFKRRRSRISACPWPWDDTYMHGTRRMQAMPAVYPARHGKTWHCFLLFVRSLLAARQISPAPPSTDISRNCPPKSSPRRKCLRPKCRTQACSASVLALSASPNIVSREVLGASSTRAARGADDIMCVAAWVPVPRTQPASSLASEHGKIASSNTMRCVVERVTQRRRADSGNAED